MAGVGLDYSQKRVNSEAYRDGNLDARLSVGVGLDIGVTNLITLSPFVNVQYAPSISWHELGTYWDASPRDVESSMRQLQLGVRIGFRPDYE